MSTFLVLSSCIASPIPTPALLISTSIRPYFSRCASTTFVRSSSSAMFAATSTTSCPAARSSSAVAVSFSGRREEMVSA